MWPAQESGCQELMDAGLQALDNRLDILVNDAGDIPIVDHPRSLESCLDTLSISTDHQLSMSLLHLCMKQWHLRCKSFAWRESIVEIKVVGNHRSRRST